MKAATVATIFAAGVAATWSPDSGSGWGEGSAPSNGSEWMTEVLTAYTTFCPGPTSITHGGSTYTVTEATTLTITNCPCTVTYSKTTSEISSCTTCASETPSSTPAPSSTPETTPASPVVPSPPASTAAPTFPVPGNGTTPAGPTAPSAAPTKSSPSTSPIATFTGAADKAVAMSGAGLAALFGLVAYAL